MFSGVRPAGRLCLVGPLILGMLVGCSPARRASDSEFRATLDLLGSAVCLGEIRERFPDFKPLTSSVIHPTFGRSVLHLFNSGTEPSATCTFVDGNVERLTFTPKGQPSQTWLTNEPLTVR
jgi:hypothetical protein